MYWKRLVLAGLLSASLSPAQAARADSGDHQSKDKPVSESPMPHMGPAMMSPQDTMQNMRAMGLVMPAMSSERGRRLFASKGCVVCHAVNGIGGEDAPPLDAAMMPSPMNPFEFAARMWRGAEAMIALQRDELGEPISLNGQELADIVAFVHDAQQQKKFSESDILENIQKIRSKAHDDGDGDDHDESKSENLHD